MKITLLLLSLLVPLTVVSCGKKGPPSAPGPADQITWPRVYPTH